VTTLAQEIPDVDVLLSLAPEELAWTLLKIVRNTWGGDRFHTDSFTSTVAGTVLWGDLAPMYQQRINEVEVAVAEAVQWLTIHMLIIPEPGYNGTNGFKVLSRRGRALADEAQFRDYRQAAAFPKAMLHPSIADDVWLNLSRSEFSNAVFIAFRKVEECVREAAGFSEGEHGVPMMRRAFHKDNGPLTDQQQHEGEREALANLFAGAIGSYKNPHSHRTVLMNDAREAQEMVMLASHLLRIVDARRGPLSE
jgi:uncharacterized protein (TIGR02391 family)